LRASRFREVGDWQNDVWKNDGKIMVDKIMAEL
jgi:hypothetical protein